MALLLAVAGVSTGLGYGLRAGGAGPQAARMLGRGAGSASAGAGDRGTGVAAFGLAPRACAAVDWVALGLVVAVSLFGQSLELSHGVLDLSPFTHVPRLPGVGGHGPPLAALSALAVALAGAGLAALGRRDL